MSEENNPYIVEISEVRRTYRLGGAELEVLRGIDWNIRRGSYSCLLGASGSGKSTLLSLIGTLEKPDSGHIRISDVDVSALSRSQAAHFRNRKIGFVFQSYHLLPELSILENAMLPGTLGGMSRKQAREKAAGLLENVGLGHRFKHRPNELSGGEQQRAAIARALINQPELLLADEPTGNLDSRTGREILDLFHRLREDNPEQTIVIITHNRDIAAETDEQVELIDGLLHH